MIIDTIIIIIIINGQIQIPKSLIIRIIQDNKDKISPNNPHIVLPIANIIIQQQELIKRDTHTIAAKHIPITIIIITHHIINIRIDATIITIIHIHENNHQINIIIIVPTSFLYCRINYDLKIY